MRAQTDRRGAGASEYEFIQIVEISAAQTVTLIGQIIAINFAMIVAIYYFLNQAGRALKIASFVLYILGTLTFFLLAVQESNIHVSAVDGLQAIGADSLSPVGQKILALRHHPLTTAMTILIMASLWALWFCVSYLLFIWKSKDTD